MGNIFIDAAIISFVFFIVRFIEMRFIDKESKPLKLLVRDSLLVYFSVICGNFVIEQLKPIIQDGGSENVVIGPTVFVDNPGF
uniref:Uncharacterized protein n=1 Tax=viral metagenome TaxID=1070528 RepID=A0A6C0KU56_9ZZZZ